MGACWKFKVVLAVLYILSANSTGAVEDELELQARLAPCELVNYFGYPCEISHVATEDGYILEVDRVRHGRNETASTIELSGTARQPLLLVPVFASASDIWFINYPSQTPGFLFADAGFDVWSMNCRETEWYSNHTKLSKDDPEYWNFSFHEIGYYDVAAVINHVLNVTGAPKLTLLSHSQGVTAILALLSTRPEYNDKVNLFVGYGPVANLSHLGLPLSLLIPFTPALLFIAEPLSRAGYLGAGQDLSTLLTKVCNILISEKCSPLITITLFSSPYQLNETRMPVYVGHYPIGTTIQNFRHYYQIYRAKEFVMYDHGKSENLRRYNQATPPPYPLERITVPVALFSSDGDQVADSRDVADLVARLGPRVVLHHVVPQRTFRHVDFSIGYRANDLLHNVATDIMRQYAIQSR